MALPLVCSKTCRCAPSTGGGSHRQEATVNVQLEQKLVATWRNAPLKVPVNRQAVAIGTARVVGTEQSQVFARNALSATGLERAVIDALRCQAAQHGSQSLERQRAVKIGRASCRERV